MDETDRDFVVSVGLAMRRESSASTAALFNAYFERRRLAGLTERLTGDDVVKLALLMHHSTPPDALRVPAAPPELPQGDADPFHSEVERRNGRPVLSTRLEEELAPARTTPTFAAPGQEE